MNWCKIHWDRLREIIKEKGLERFCSATPEGAAESLMDTEKFDPLMGSWIRINSAMASSSNFNGRIGSCPLCILVDDGQPELVEDWLQGVTDNAFDYAVEQGLISKSN